MPIILEVFWYFLCNGNMCICWFCWRGTLGYVRWIISLLCRHQFRSRVVHSDVRCFWFTAHVDRVKQWWVWLWRGCCGNARLRGLYNVTHSTVRRHQRVGSRVCCSEAFFLSFAESEPWLPNTASRAFTSIWVKSTTPPETGTCMATTTPTDTTASR